MYDSLASLPLEAWTVIVILLVIALVLRILWVKRRNAIRLEPIDLPPERMPFSAWLRLQTARMSNMQLKWRLRHMTIPRASLLKKLRRWKESGYSGLKPKTLLKTPDVNTPSRRKLDDLTNAEIQRIGKRYGIYVTGKVGTSYGRVLFFLGFVAVVIFLSGLLAWFATAMLHIDSLVEYWLITSAFAALGIGWGLTEWFIVSVPKLTGLITTNYFTKELHSYGTGWGIKYPWENYSLDLDDYIDLQADIVEKVGPDGKATGSTFITKERIPLTFNWTVQFRPYLRLLPVYVSTENKAIQQGLEEVVESVIAVTITGEEVDNIKNPDTLKKIRENLAKALEGEDIGGRAPLLDEEGSTIEQRFGLKVELDTFSPPKFAQDYQEAMTASKVLETVAANAKSIKESLQMDGKAAFDRVLVANKENAEIKITSFEASQNIVDAVKEVGQMLASALAGRNTPPTGNNPAGNAPGGTP